MYTTHGNGNERVILLHNWFSDSTSFLPMLPYLDMQKYTYLFVDLRGYGKSKDLEGKYDIDEAVNDLIAIMDSLAWQRVHLVGHSMSGLIAQKLAVEHSNRIKSLIALTPVPASGSSNPPEVEQFLKSTAQGNVENAVEAIQLVTGRRLSNSIATKMVDHWLTCSKEKARLGYLNMFSHTNFASRAKGLSLPVLLVYAEYDFEGSEKVLIQKFSELYPNLTIECCEGSGHFPTQETPIYLASLMERFFEKIL